MKKIRFMFLALCCSFELHAIELDGKFLSQSGELMFIVAIDGDEIAGIKANLLIDVPCTT